MTHSRRANHTRRIFRILLMHPVSLDCNERFLNLLQHKSKQFWEGICIINETVRGLIRAELSKQHTLHVFNVMRVATHAKRTKKTTCLILEAIPDA